MHFRIDTALHHLLSEALGDIQRAWVYAHSLELKDIIGLWGGFVATGLLIVRLFELWGSRLRLSTSFNFADFEHGNTVTIFNASKRGVQIEHWELLWVSNKLFRRTVSQVDTNFDFGDSYFQIKENDRRILSFSDENYFKWSHAPIERGALYLKLRVVGRRCPLYLKVYDPKSR